MYRGLENYHEKVTANNLTDEQKLIVKFLIQNLERLENAIEENEELQIKSRVSFTEEQERAFIYSDNETEILSRLNYGGSVRTFHRRLESYIEKFVAQYDIKGSKQAPLFIKADGTRTKRQILPQPINK